MNQKKRDENYLSIVLDPIRICASYLPKMGHGIGAGLKLDDFQKLYGEDTFYSWFGLDNPLMYAAHKAAGGMTSIYRQIGIGCERLFRAVLKDELNLTDSDVNWAYTINGANDKLRKLSLDGRIILDKVGNSERREKITRWILESCKYLGVSSSISKSLKGAVFEVRQGYKSKDSKRQNADISNAATAYTQAYLPCVIVLSSQIDTDIVVRYKNEKWLILTGLALGGNTLDNTYKFFEEVVGYDLADFFSRNSTILRREMDNILKSLLQAK